MLCTTLILLWLQYHYCSRRITKLNYRYKRWLYWVSKEIYISHYSFVNWILGTAGFCHSPFLFMSFELWWILTASSICLWGEVLWNIQWPSCYTTSRFHGGRWCCAFRCSSPLENIFLLVSPWYCALQVLHVMKCPLPSLLYMERIYHLHTFFLAMGLTSIAESNPGTKLPPATRTQKIRVVRGVRCCCSIFSPCAFLCG